MAAQAEVAGGVHQETLGLGKRKRPGSSGSAGAGARGDPALALEGPDRALDAQSPAKRRRIDDSTPQQSDPMRSTAPETVASVGEGISLDGNSLESDVPGEQGIPFAGAERPLRTIGRRGAAAGARAGAFGFALALWARELGAVLEISSEVAKAGSGDVDEAQEFRRAALEVLAWVGSELSGGLPYAV